MTALHAGWPIMAIIPYYSMAPTPACIPPTPYIYLLREGPPPLFAKGIIACLPVHAQVRAEGFAGWMIGT